MLSSSDTSALFAAQQAQFAQTNAYAQQLGMQVPQSGGGFARPPPPSFPGMAPPPPSFSYAPGNFQGYQFGNRMAGSAMSAMGGGAQLLGTGLGVASMFGKMGALGSLVDPFAGAMAGYGAGGMAGAAMGAALPLGLAYAGSRAVGSFIHGGQQQSMINSTMGENFQFMNAGARGGQGFDRTSMQGVGQVIRQIANVPEMMTSVEELTRMIPKLRQMGSMQGVRDLQEFSRRFKEQVTTIRDMSRVLGTTMEEAADMFAHSKAVGMRTPTQMLQNALSVKFVAAQTGMSTDQVMGMQQAGANMATGMGIRRQQGSTAVTNVAQMLQKGVERGRIAQADLEDITGMQGPEAMSAAAQMMTGTLTQAAKGTSAGRLMMFGLAKFDASGRYAGIDEDLAKGLQSGAVGREELMRRASRLTDQQKMAASGHIESMSMDLAGKIGPGGFGQFLKGVVGARYGENSTQLLMTKFGISETQADVFEKMAGMVGTGDDDKELFGRLRQRESQIKERTDPKAIWERLKTRLHRQTFGRLEEAGSKFHEYIGRTIDNWVDDMTGRAVVEISEAGAKKLESAFTGAGGSALDDMLKGASQNAARTGTSVGAALRGEGRGLMGRLSDTELFAGITSNPMSARGQFIKTAQGLGVDVDALSGLSPEAANRAVQQQQDKFGKMGAGMGGTAMDLLMGARDTVAGANFDQESKQKQFDLLQEQVEGRMKSIAYKEANGMPLTAEEKKFKEQSAPIIAEARRAKVAGSGSEATYGSMAITQALAAQVGIGQGVNINDVVSDQKIKNMAKWGKEAEEGLNDVLGAQGAAAIKANPALAKVLGKISEDSQEGAALKKMLMTGTPEEALEALKKAGMPVNPGDIATLKDMATKLHAKMRDGKGQDSMDKINDFVKYDQTKAVEAFIGTSKEAAKDVTDTAVGGALAALGTAEIGKPDDVKAKVAAVGAALAGAEKRLMAAKTPEEKKKIMESLGAFGAQANMAAMQAQGLRVGSTVSEEKMAQQMGISVEELRKSGIKQEAGGQIRITKDVQEQAAAMALQHSAGGRILQAGKMQAAGDKDLGTILTKLDQTMSLNTTALVALATKDKDMAEKVKQQAADAANHTGQSEKVTK